MDLDKMAEARYFQDEFTCPVCLDLLKDPVTIQCGHSYCKSCITDCWDQEDQKRVYSCPQCRHTFSPRPALARNTMLTEVTEKLKKRKRPADCDAESKYKLCYCTQQKHCQCAYIYYHLFVLQKQLKEMQETFQQRIQQREKDLQQLRETVESHKVSLEKKRSLSLSQFRLTEAESLCVLTALCTDSSGGQTNYMEGLSYLAYTSLSLSLFTLIRAKCLKRKLQHKFTDLQTVLHTSLKHRTRKQESVQEKRNKMAEARYFQDEFTCPVCLDLLKDPVTIQCGHSYCENCITARWDQEDQMRVYTAKSCLVCLNSYCQNHLEQHESWFRGKRHKLTEKLLEIFCCTDQKYICMLCTIIEHKNHDVVSAAEQRTEKQLTLDLNTVNKHLRLSENNRVITGTKTVQSYPDHPDRFDHYRQVLCRGSVCGRCYWELEWSGDIGVCISVSYKSIIRKGRGYECLFGCNDQSWSLICTPFSYSLRHSNIKTDLPVESISSRIGVFVNHSAGTLSFYSVSDTMSLIHTVQTTFTQPLYPGFGFYKRASVKLC
uniref:Uncharacterized protein n=1 Tax=Cyprinus carpio TaxID=7962 RepID=A0A8C1R1Y3_CYPCA